MYRIGIDIGSTYTKYCVMNCENNIIDLFLEKTPVRQKEYFDKKLEDLRARYQNAVIISCGYGRKNIPALKNISELTALAWGSHYISPESPLVLDIGGQDTKIIWQENGKLKEFFINDKCAAGSGMFLTNTSGLLDIDFDRIDLTDAQCPEVRLSSVCAVFAQSEIVELLAANTPTETILHSVVWQILIQAKTLLGKVPDGALLLSGGMTQIKGMEAFAEKALGRQCLVPEHGVYLSAIGCAALCAAGKV